MSNPRVRILALSLMLAVAVWVVFGAHSTRRWLVVLFDAPYAQALGFMEPSYDGPDAARVRVPVRLLPVASGLTQPTDIQFVPGRSDVAVVLQKGGEARWLRIADGTSGVLFSVDVLTTSEQGLLGLAFAPDFERSGRFFVNLTPAGLKKDASVVEEWRVDLPSDLPAATAQRVRVVLSVDQPYQNHNAGQLAFGPDGMLYIGWGDGGFRDDPDKHGQNPHSHLSSMLRIDVSGASDDAPYRVPADNPWANAPEVAAPEVWAYGLRNPWRYSFDPSGRLVAGDVGQNQYEEITFVRAGSNLGWPIREGARCYKPKSCDPTGLLDPIWEYPREEGTSVTGGFVYQGETIPALKSQYVFADFTTGRIWAMPLPASWDGTVDDVATLGRWPLLVSAFGQDADGELYVADFGGGVIYRMQAG